MKKLIFLSLLFLTSMQLMAQDQINWLSLEEVETKSKIENRKVMVFFETDWCGFCKKMNTTVFQEPEVVSYLNENYYAVRFNAEAKDSITFDGIKYGFDSTNGRRGAHELAIDMLQGYMAYPSVVFLDEDNKSIRKLMGLQPKDLFSLFLRYVNEDAYKNQDWFVYSGQESQ